MDARGLQQIKDTIAAAELKSAKAQGAIEKIQADWKKEFDITTLEEAEAKLSELQLAIQQNTKRRDDLWAELQALQNWDELEEEVNA